MVQVKFRIGDLVGSEDLNRFGDMIVGWDLDCSETF